MEFILSQLAAAIGVIFIDDLTARKSARVSLLLDGTGFRQDRFRRGLF